MDRKLRPAPVTDNAELMGNNANLINRRKFLRYGLNSATGVIAVTLGVLGFASVIMPPGGSSSGDLSVKYWAKGREDEAWYGADHLQPMKKSDFVEQAKSSSIGMSGAQGVWNGLPVNVTYVPHSKNAGKPLANNIPRFQLTEGKDATGKIIGHFEDLSDADPILFPSDDLVMVFSRCTHLCCIPGWQLVANDYTEDSWTPGGGDVKGSKLFCICHSSRFNPTVLEMNTNRNRSNGQTFNYAGIARSGGPAPVGLPIIPIAVNADVIEGLTTYVDWLTYCD